MSAFAGRIAATASAVLLAVGCCPFPAIAAATEATIATRFQQLTLAPGGEGQEALLWAAVDAGDTSGIDVINYTVDYSGITSFAEVELTEAFQSIALGSLSPTGDNVSGTASAAPSEGGCTAGGTTFVCSVRAYLEGTAPLFGLGYFGIKPKADAEAGDAGVVKVTASVGDGTESTSESPVRIGEGISLEALESDAVESAPGETAELTGRLHNAGSTAAEGVALFLGVRPDVLTGTRYSNCEYGYAVLCTFDTTLQPGTTYELAEPFGIGIPDDAIDGSRLESEFSWTSVTEWEDLVASWPEDLLDDIFGDRQPGDGGELALTEVTSAAGTPQVELDYTNNNGAVTVAVAGGAVADFAAVGDKVTATAGSDVNVRIGVVNNGPGRLYPDLFENNHVIFDVRLPPHTYMDGTGAVCSAKDPNRFPCATVAALEPGQREVYDFDVEVEEKPGQKGSVQVQELSDSGANDNDTASIVIDVAGGDDLPITGPGGLLTGGLLLLAVGTGVRFLSRRRSGPVG
ncbi:hypothetical protein AB0F72_02345 [Actinoplanes sp. NPDC023936]|uniref:hypothetical protein n=1 Tax=Actinoplanes sp. NPDC023936 TaxID=3154910 RepID=UPI0033C4AE01